MIFYERVIRARKFACGWTSRWGKLACPGNDGNKDHDMVCDSLTYAFDDELLKNDAELAALRGRLDEARRLLIAMWQHRHNLACVCANCEDTHRYLTALYTTPSPGAPVAPTGEPTGEVCRTCGHSRARHTFGYGLCLTCECAKFEPAAPPVPVPTPAPEPKPRVGELCGACGSKQYETGHGCCGDDCTLCGTTGAPVGAPAGPGSPDDPTKCLKTGQWCCDCVNCRAPGATPGERVRWRVGRTVGRTLYLDDKLVGVMDDPSLAALVVQALRELGQRVDMEARE